MEARRTDAGPSCAAMGVLAWSPLMRAAHMGGTQHLANFRQISDKYPNQIIVGNKRSPTVMYPNTQAPGSEYLVLVLDR